MHEKLEKIWSRVETSPERSLDSLTQQMGMSSSLAKNETELLHFISITQMRLTNSITHIIQHG